MSVRKEFVTKSGLTLPLTNLKGKEYLLAAHRILWFVTDTPRYTMETKFLELSQERAVVMTTITTFDEEGKIIRRADGVKAEDKKDFADFSEKAVTGSQARALLFLGFGTQFSGDELNELMNEKGQEVNRLADAPLAPKAETPKQESEKGEPPKAAGSFRKPTPAKEAPKAAIVDSGGEGWD